MAETTTETETDHQAPAPGTELVAVTEKAQAMARKFLADEAEPGDKALRVGVDAGGCSGFSYKVELDVIKEGDHIQDYGDGLRVVCDEISLPFLKNARVDYEDTIGHAGFKFDNPQATGTCGCGTSFSV